MSNDALHVDMHNEADWPLKSIESLCSIVSRGTSPAYVEHSDVLAIGQRCIAATGFVADLARPHSHRAMRNVLRPEPGDVLLNSTGTGTIGRSTVFNAQGTFVVDGHVTVIRPIAEAADSRWLDAVMHTPSFQRHLERFCYSGSTNQVELSRTPLRQSYLPTPQIEEQRAIAQVLDTVDTAIRETEAIIAKLKAVKQGLLHDLLTRGIDANGELRPPQSEAPHLYKQSPLGWIPKEWEVRDLGSCAEVAGGVTLGRAVSGPGVIEVPYLRVANVQDGFIDLSEVKSVRILKSELDRFALRPGDVLMNEGGDFDKLGRGAVWQGQVDPCLHQNHVFRVRCTRSILLPDYLAAYSASARGKRYFIQASKQTTNLASINSTQLKAFGVALPPTNEQVLIVDRARQFDAYANSEAATVDQLSRIKIGLMDDLLTGRVRVTPLLPAELQAQTRSA